MISHKSVFIENERDYISALKIFAVISIVSAHSNYVPPDTNRWNILFSWILGEIGAIGVAIFFIISGYVFYKNKYPLDQFFLRKVKTIFLPWFATGTLVYLYIALRKDGVSLYNWLGFILGYNSYLYFLSLLMFFYIIFFYNSKNKILIYSSIFLSAISILLTAAGLLAKINSYLNPFNFIIYFSIGLLIADKDNLMKLAQTCTTYRKLLGVIYITLLVLINIFEISSGYWGYSTLIVQPIAVLLVFGLSTKHSLYNDQVLRLGRESFSIYLLHIPVAGIIANIFNRFNLWPMTLFRPFIVIGITIVFISLYRYVSSKLKLSKILNPIIGIR